MLKRLFIGLILFFAIVAGLYQLRTQLLTSAFNSALASADIRLLQMEGLQLGWDGVVIERLVLGIGEADTRQTLQGMHLSYSVVDLQPHSLSLEKAVLRQPPAGGQEKGSTTPLLLSDMLEQVLAGPLQTIAVEEIEVEGLSHSALSPPVSLRAGWEADQFSLHATDRDKQLALKLHRLSENEKSLTASLHIAGEQLIAFSATISPRGGRRHIEGTGRLWVEAARPILSELVTLPQSVAAVSGELSFQLSGQLDDEMLALESHKWQLQLLQQTSLEVELAAENLEARLDLDLAQPLIVSLQAFGTPEPEISVKGERVAWQLYEQRNAIRAAGQLSDIQCENPGAPACSASLSVEMNAQKIALGGEQPTIVQNPAVNLSGQLSLDTEQLALLLEPGRWLGAGLLTQGGTRVIAPFMAAHSAGTLNYRLSSGELVFEVDELQLGLPRAQLPDLNVATLLGLQGVALSRDADGVLTASARLIAEAINLQRPGTWLPALATDSTLALQGQSISLEGSVSGSDQLQLFRFTAQYQLDTERGNARILSEGKRFDAEGRRLSQHFSHWPFEWDIFEGELDLDLGLQWKNGEQGIEVRGEINQQLRDLAGVYADIGFLGLSAEVAAEFQSPDQFVTTKPAIISLESLDVGVPVERIELSLQLDAAQQAVKILSAEARLFDARVWIEDALYRADKAHNPVFIGVDGMQLHKLLALAGYDAVKATGTISGLLPLDVTQAGITMERGMLAAKAPGGVFSYRTEVTEGTNPAMVQVIEALKNYHYSIFQVEADYLENGDLVLAMTLRGKNPDFQQARPVHLNLNVTDNIPTLLKSLQSGRVIADTVGKKVGGSAR